MNHSLPVKQAFKESLIRSKPVLKRIVLTTIPITILSFYLIYLGFFSHLTQWLRPVIHLLPLPPEALSIIVAQFGGHLPAYTLASNFLVNHLLGSKEVILALLWGTVVTSIVSLLGHFWPSFRHTAYADFHWFKANSYHYDSNFYPLVVLKNQKR